MLERATRYLAKLKQRLLKVSADFKLTIVDRAIDQWRKWLQACVKAVDGRFVYLYCFLGWDDSYTTCGGVREAGRS